MVLLNLYYISDSQVVEAELNSNIILLKSDICFSLLGIIGSAKILYHLFHLILTNILYHSLA